ncbi:MAG: hypothetical protein WD038_11375 [Balneolales bacterium]
MLKIRPLPYLIATLCGLLALFVPLLRDLHIESAVPAALVGAFFGGIYAACNKRNTDGKGLTYVMSVIYTAAIPLLVSNISTGCITLSGLGFWFFYPSISVYFGYAIGRYFRVADFRLPVFYSILSLLVVAIGIWLIELYLLPQVYFHNHVWGGWPGTIYDVEVEFTGSDLFFRVITFSWASLLWLAPDFQEKNFAKFGVVMLALGLMFSYSQLSQAGIISPRSHLQNELGGHLETEHFDIYYSKDHFSDYEIQRTAEYHEFHLKEISITLDIDLPPDDHKIESYLYGHPWQMKELVGAKNVSYVPVWSSVDQLHIGKDALARTLRHELVHVAAKQFGNRVLKASWSIGLLEGIAVALSPASREITTIDQTVAANEGILSSKEIRRLLSPTGFYSGRGAVNYTIAGSFVGYLLDEYPVENFKAAYRHSDLEGAYPLPLDTLVAGWYKQLDEVEFDITEQRAGERIFETPSILEQDCPRVMSDEYRLSDRYMYFMAEADTASALLALEELMHLDAENEDAWRYWSTLNFNENGARDLWDIVPDHNPHNPFYLIKQADLAMLDGIQYKAEEYLDQFESALPSAGGAELKAMLERRSDNQTWSQLVSGLYQTSKITKEDFEAMNEDIRFYTIQEMLKQNNRNDILEFLNVMTDNDYNPMFFDIYLKALEYASLNDDHQTAQKLAIFVGKQELRPLERIRLNELTRFSRYLERSHKELLD